MSIPRHLHHQHLTEPTYEGDWPVVSRSYLESLPPVLAGVVRALGYARARWWLGTYGGVMISLPKHKTKALGLEDQELSRLNVALKNHLDDKRRVVLPKADKLFLKIRNHEIRMARGTSSLNQLARQYSLTSRQIVNICREDDSRQPDLF